MFITVKRRYETEEKEMGEMYAGRAVLSPEVQAGVGAGRRGAKY